MKIAKFKILLVFAMMSVLAATFLRPQLTAASEIVDDGLHRIELVLARDAAFAREVWIRDCPSFAPLSFPWDNELENSYDIKRLSDGNYLITLFNDDPLLPSVSRLVLIKIWDRASGLVVYDNQMGADDNASPVTALGGGAVADRNGSRGSVRHFFVCLTDYSLVLNILKSGFKKCNLMQKG